MVMASPSNTDMLLAESVAAAARSERLQPGDLLVITSGTPVGKPGSTNLIKVHYLGDPL